MPANTAIYANVPGWLWDRNTHMELWLRVNWKESDIIWQYLYSKLSRFCFIVLDICLALATAQAKNIAIALAITLVMTS